MQRAGTKLELAPDCQKDLSFQDWPQIKITGLCDDTRFLKAGMLFCNTPQAFPYFTLALEKMPAALLVEDTQIEEVFSLLRERKKNVQIPILICKDLLKTQGKLASAFFGNPSQKMQIVAITGTNGKTTIAWLLYRIWQNLGYRAAMIGSLGFYWHSGEKELCEKTGYTTPRAWQLQEILSKLVEHKIERVSLEASSEGLDWGRLYALKVHTAIFTGLSQDHLDHHKNMENYYQAKKKLFVLCRESKGKMVLSLQDKYGKALAEEMRAYPKLSCLSRPKLPERIDLGYGKIQVPDFYAWNLSLALEGANLKEEEREKTLHSLVSKLSFPPGRFELVFPKNYDEENITEAVYGIVDYAHTPDALERVLLAARKNAKSLVCVFGCGGNRDAKKRPLMGKLAARLSDMLFLCDDNPRQEKASNIIKDIKKGISKGANVQELHDRKRAIQEAVQWARKAHQKPAVILIAGKGDEDYQILKNETIFFSDRLVLKKALG